MISPYAAMRYATAVGAGLTPLHYAEWIGQRLWATYTAAAPLPVPPKCVRGMTISAVFVDEVAEL